MTLKIAVLGSTRGSSLQPILDQMPDGVELVKVLSNNKSAYILERARQHGISTEWLDPKEFKGRDNYDREVTRVLEESGVELILLIGYMKLMSNEFVEHWKHRVLNIHPSILPAYAGGMDMNVHQAVLDRGCKISGASLILIDQGADTGPIVSQRVVAIDENDTAESLKIKVQVLEGEMMRQVLCDWRDGVIEVIDRGEGVSPWVRISRNGCNEHDDDCNVDSEEDIDKIYPSKKLTNEYVTLIKDFLSRKDDK